MMDANRRSVPGELPLFLASEQLPSVPLSLHAQVDADLALARRSLFALHEIDRAAAVILAWSPGLRQAGRSALELARVRARAEGRKSGFLNRLAQIAQRRWRAFHLPVTFASRSDVLDLVTDAEWRTLPLAPELAAFVPKTAAPDENER